MEASSTSFESNNDYVEEETILAKSLRAKLPRTEWLNLDMTLVNGAGMVVVASVV